MFSGNSSNIEYDVIIIGAGISGLSAAQRLQKEGLNFIILEASDSVGGRIKTDYVKDYQLDRGFQVLLTAYPETQNLFDYSALKLKSFDPGAVVQYGYKSYQLSDPFRKPITALRNIRNPFTAVTDMIKIVALRNRHKRFSVEQLFKEKEQTTIDYLKEWNFTDKFIESFMRPFLGGIYLDNKLEVSSRMMEFVFKMFTEGYAALPENGMQAIPKQLAKDIPNDKISFKTKVANVELDGVTLADGSNLKAKSIIIATDAESANKIYPCKNETKSQSVKCVYFSADSAPFSSPMIYLNGNASGLVNNVVIPTNLHKSYAPKDKHLISVSVIKPSNLNDLELVLAIRSELKVWFGSAVEEWMHLRTYNIEKALPKIPSLKYAESKDIEPMANNIYKCGDYTQDPSINGAILSGRLTAEAIIWGLSVKL